MIVYFAQQFEFTEATHVFFRGHLFSKEVFALVSKLFKAINQDLRQHKQLTVISGLQLEILLMYKKGAQVPTQIAVSICKACRLNYNLFICKEKYEKWEEKDREAKLFLL